MTKLEEKLNKEPWFLRISDEFGEDLKGDCINFIEDIKFRDYKIQVWGVADDGEGMVQDLGIYEDYEDINLHTNMFNNIEITFEKVFEEEK